MISQAGIRTNALKLLSAAACIGVFCALASLSYFGIGGHRDSPIAQLADPVTTGSIAIAPPPPPPPSPAPVAEAPPPKKPEPTAAALADLDSAGLASLIGAGGVKPAPAPKKAAVQPRPPAPEKVARR
jgi:hypothetical protein